MMSDGNSRTYKMKMNFNTWIEIKKIAAEVNAEIKNEKNKIEIEEFIEVEKSGKLIWHLTEMKFGLREKLEEISFYE